MSSLPRITSVHAWYPRYEPPRPGWRAVMWQIAVEIETAAGLRGLGVGGGGGAAVYVHAHIKDHVGRDPDFEHRIAGEGELDHAHYLRLLREIGFEGFLAHECFTDMPLQRACEVGHRTPTSALPAVSPGSDR